MNLSSRDPAATIATGACHETREEALLKQWYQQSSPPPCSESHQHLQLGLTQMSHDLYTPASNQRVSDSGDRGHRSQNPLGSHLLRYLCINPTATSYLERIHPQICLRDGFLANASHFHAFYVMCIKFTGAWTIAH
jgi:hypothetical protein